MTATLPLVIYARKPLRYPSERYPTYCGFMSDEAWRNLEGTWDRLRWARLRAGFERAKDAADSMGIKPGTYAAYERRPGSSKHIGLDHQLAARLARKFHVSWEWLLTGSGAPIEGPEDRVMSEMNQIQPDMREDLANAIVSLIATFKRAAS